MICFPNAKINLGLNIISKRPDGYHNIETVFYPIGLSDILEFTETEKGSTKIQISGINLDIPDNQNICIKAFELLSAEFALRPMEIFLHKAIPSGAGLGGGSSDAAFFLKALNSHFNIGLREDDLESFAARIGSDCAFFIRNKPVFAQGRGEIFEPVELSLKDYHIYLIKPDAPVNTAQAYSKVKPDIPKISVKEIIKRPVDEWKELLNNDFEQSIFQIYPELAIIKHELYGHGAVYASMSGSGSSIFGIFKNKPDKIDKFASYFNWISQM